jgi:type IV pilus assembly protein PilC
MAQFSYQARNQRGEMVSGVVTAETEAEAARVLRVDGKFVTRLQKTDGDDDAVEVSPLSIAQHGRRVRREEVIYFCHQMAIMMQTGVPISEALDSITRQTASIHFKAVLQDVTDTVQGGVSLSLALARHQRVFPTLMVSLIQASEASGTMGEMLERISMYLTKERQTLKKVRGALMYPMFMFAVAMLVTVFLLLFVLPRFAKIYENRGAALPLPTQLLISTSNIALTYWYVGVAAIVAAVAGVIALNRSEGGRRFLDQLKLNLPLLGPLFNQLYITRAMQTMGTMIAAGVPMLEMVSITRRVTQNACYQGLWDRVDEKLRHGAQLSDPLFESSLIPPSISRMIHSGEKSGRLGMVMQRIAEFTESDFDESVKRTTQFIEPVMVCVMGLVIGGVAISLLLPIFSVGRVMAGGH